MEFRRCPVTLFRCTAVVYLRRIPISKLMIGWHLEASRVAKSNEVRGLQFWISMVGVILIAFATVGILLMKFRASFALLIGFLIVGIYRLLIERNHQPNVWGLPKWTIDMLLILEVLWVLFFLFLIMS